LQNGEWEGRQLVAADWVAAATSRQTSNGSNPASDWDQGYGYQFWRCRHGFYRGDGAFGQFCIVMPEYDAVLAVTSGTSDMGAVMQIAWDHLVPGMSTASLPHNDAASRALQDRIKSLRLPPAEGNRSSPLAETISGREFSFPENEKGIDTIALSFADDSATLSVTDEHGRHDFKCAYADWSKGRMPSIGSLAQRLPRSEDVGIAASGAWSSEDTFTIKLWQFETPYRLELELKFSGDQVTLNGEYNVAFAAKKLPTLVGRHK
jgi:hypothetical protein